MVNRSTPPGLRILVDGPDLSGKSSLVRQLAGRLAADGWSVCARKGQLAPAPWRRFLSRFDPNQHPRSALLNTGYLAAALLDRLHAPRIAPGSIDIVESYVDRSIAYGVAFGLGWPAALALRHARAFPDFDLAILVTADLETRRERLAKRENPSRIDSLAVESHDRFHQAYQRVFARHRNHLVLDTSSLTLDNAAEAVMTALREVASSRAHGPIAERPGTPPRSALPAGQDAGQPTS